MLRPPITDAEPNDDGSPEALDESTARARREVGIIGSCQTPHLVKLGPIPLTAIEHQGLRDLKQILAADGPRPVAELVSLGAGITEAVKELWQERKIHRDIKPGNIMRRETTGDFVLLDMGMALDLDDVSLTTTGLVVGTMIYCSPEQVEFARKRQMDFRSDLFSLGIVLYEAATGHHPFWSQGLTSHQGLGNMLSVRPASPSSHAPDLAAAMETVIVRLLAKQPHLRYRTCDDLLAALAAVPLA